MSDDEIQSILKEWSDAKETISQLEKACKKYKAFVERLMNRADSNEIKTTEFTVKRRNMTRPFMTKDSVPAEIWKEYAQNISYPCYYISKNKDKKKKKLIKRA